VPGIELRIACGPAETADEGTIGEIQLTGSSVTAGYVGVDAKAQPFSQDGWLRTGDLGFLLDGELFVVGRLKDMVIVHGQNFYAEDVEDVVRKTPGLDRQVCAAFGRGISHDERERMVVLWETGLLPGDAAVAVDRIIRRLSDQLGLVAVEVVPVVANTIPFTSSGKVKRSAAIGVWRSARAAADAIDLLSESRPSERIHA
jgi:acyl-CoA synthetase (AMP-forming)/AMP-acid ligase II